MARRKPPRDVPEPEKTPRKKPKKSSSKAPKGSSIGLNYQSRLFVTYFLGKAKGNASEAARLAGYSSPGTLGSRLLKKVEVLAAISAHLHESALSTDEILSRLSDIATCSIGDYIKVNKQGLYTIDLRRALNGGKLHCIKSLKCTEHGVGIELHDPMAALDKLARYRSLFAERPIDPSLGAEPLDSDAAKRALQAAEYGPPS